MLQCNSDFWGERKQNGHIHTYSFMTKCNLSENSMIIQMIMSRHINEVQNMGVTEVIICTSTASVTSQWKRAKCLKGSDEQEIHAWQTDRFHYMTTVIENMRMASHSTADFMKGSIIWN